MESAGTRMEETIEIVSNHGIGQIEKAADRHGFDNEREGVGAWIS